MMMQTKGEVNYIMLRCQPLITGMDHQSNLNTPIGFNLLVLTISIENLNANHNLTLIVDLSAIPSRRRESKSLLPKLQRHQSELDFNREQQVRRQTKRTKCFSATVSTSIDLSKIAKHSSLSRSLVSLIERLKRDSLQTSETRICLLLRCCMSFTRCKVTPLHLDTAKISIRTLRLSTTSKFQGWECSLQTYSQHLTSRAVPSMVVLVEVTQRTSSSIHLKTSTLCISTTSRISSICSSRGLLKVIS